MSQGFCTTLEPTRLGGVTRVLHCARADKAGEVSQGFCTMLEPTGWGAVTRVLHYARADKAGGCHKGSAPR